MNLDWFNDLAMIAETGNFSRAAAFNNISQSAFSRRIKALEAWTGARLVDRSAHPATLTAAGHQMLEAGRQAANRIESERDQIRERFERPDTYVVTFAAQHSLGWRFYPAWLQAFEASFGPIISRLRADDLPNCIADLKNEQVDFVISYESRFVESLNGPEFQSAVIGHDRLLPVSKADSAGGPIFRLRGGGANIPYLRFGPNAPIDQHIETLLTRTKLKKRLRTVYENSMGGALRIRARDGLGVVWLPQSLIQPDLDAGLLTPAADGDDADDYAIDLEICIHRLTRNTNGLVRRIWAFLKAHEGRPLT